MTSANYLGGILVLILGLIVLTGKAAFLIAGYNTMSPEEQARWDIKKISRFLGWILILGSLVLLIGGCSFNWTCPPMR